MFISVLFSRHLATLEHPIAYALYHITIRDSGLFFPKLLWQFQLLIFSFSKSLDGCAMTWVSQPAHTAHVDQNMKISFNLNSPCLEEVMRIKQSNQPGHKLHTIWNKWLWHVEIRFLDFTYILTDFMWHVPRLLFFDQNRVTWLFYKDSICLFEHKPYSKQHECQSTSWH